MPKPAHHGSHQNGDASVTTPLLAGTPLLGVDSPYQNYDHLHGRLWEFFLDPGYTDGINDHRPWVRIPFTIWHVTKVTLYSNYVNILLVFVPIGIVAGATGWDPVVVFILNFLAIIPLASVLSFATEEISAKLGEALGGLLNATFGNAVELIVSIIALRANEFDVVKSSMIGSILSNLLLVMGMCFFFGGIVNMRNPDGSGMEQSFATITAQTTCSLMTLAAASMIIPGALSLVIEKTMEADPRAKAAAILELSRGTSIILLAIYVMYLVFQLHTHHNLFAPDPTTSQADEAQTGANREEEQQETHLGPLSAAGILVVVTILVSVCADYLVGSIDSLVERAHISRNFIGLILIPIVGNAAEHVTAVVVAVKNKMDLAMGVAIGSSIQIALFVTPFLVVLGWIMDKNMTLKFETFETVSFALSVLVVTYTVQDGKSNYLEGAMLMSLYIIIAVAFFVTPSNALADSGNFI